MRLLSGRRPLWLLLASLLLFSATLVARTVLGQSLLSAAHPSNPAAPAHWNNHETIISLQDHLRLNPEDSAAYARLGLAWLQQVRETGDASLYGQAEQAFNEALRRDAEQLDALMGQGLLALARHDFTAALTWGEKARQVNPHRAQVYGIMGDAQVELGQYEAAFKTIQKMVDTRPELSSYSRVSYVRELRGDTAGAIAAMEQAVDSGLPTYEGTLWARVQLGHLYFNSGDLPQAEKIYRQAIYYRPDYFYAQAGLARVQAAQGHYQEAIQAYEAIVKRLPLPEFVIVLGELYEITGQAEQAKQQYDLVRVIQQLNTQNGMNTDLELALFNLDHGDNPAQALRQAQAGYHSRPSVYAADVIAWGFYHTGDYAQAWSYSQEALRLGTRNALWHYHAGQIALALDKLPEARHHLRQALAINPYFSILYAPQAQTLLKRLEMPKESSN